MSVSVLQKKTSVSEPFGYLLVSGTQLNKQQLTIYCKKTIAISCLFS